MESGQKRDGTFSFTVLAGMTVAMLLLVVYVLSIGPAVLLREHGYLSQETFLRVYYPLVLASGCSRWIFDALEWYARLWAA